MSDKKKILYIVEAMGGGVFTYIVDLTNALVETYDMYVAYAVRKQTPLDYKKYFDKRVHLIRVENFDRAINPAKDIPAFIEIRKIAKEVKPDIIHLHSSKAGVLGRLAFSGRKLPVFYTPHGYSFLMQNQNSAKRAIYKFIEMACGKRRCTTISCSEGEHLETLKITSRALYVSNGINITQLQDIVDTIQIDSEYPFTVFTLGRICYQKNPALFNEIALAMPNVRFVWIGDGELRNELSSPNIEITGWVERKEALSYALRANVFLLTSLWEGLPMSLVEAMYLRKLCVVTNVIGNRDVIHTDKNGFVCNTVNEFIEAISAAQKKQTEGLVENAYNDVLNSYNTSVMAKEYSAIYSKSLMMA